MRWLAPYLGYAYLTFVGATTCWRIDGEGPRLEFRKRRQRFIYAFWHCRQLFFGCTHQDQGLSVLVSRSRDGELVSRLMALLRIGACRGSSSRGAAAGLREMMEAMAQGLDIGITPDGPKGPAREVKPGVVYLAQKLRIPILPITNAVSRKCVLSRSWDKFQVPLPFGRAVVRYGKPITVAPGDDLEAKARELKTALDLITEQADREVAA